MKDMSGRPAAPTLDLGNCQSASERSMPKSVLQFAPLVPSVEAELHRRYVVACWSEIGDKAAWLAAHGSEVRVVLTSGHAGLDPPTMEALPSLGLIAVAGVGYDRIDLSLTRRKAIHVTNTPGVLAADVADLGIGLMIAVMRRISLADRHVRDGHWRSGEMALATSASDRRYGIFGLGQIGLAIARRLSGFGGSISYTGRTPKDVPYTFHRNVLELARNVDVLFVAASGAQETRGLIDRAVFDALGPEGYLVNVARGSIVDEEALVEALRERRLGGAGLDVFADEPNAHLGLAELPNVALAPHIGSATHQAREAMARLAVANIDAFFAGGELPTPVR